MSEEDKRGSETFYLDEKGERADANLHYHILDNPEAERENRRGYIDRLRSRGYSADLINRQIEIMKINDECDAYRAKNKEGK